MVDLIVFVKAKLPPTSFTEIQSFLNRFFSRITCWNALFDPILFHDKLSISSFNSNSMNAKCFLFFIIFKSLFCVTQKSPELNQFYDCVIYTKITIFSLKQTEK